MNSVFVQRSIPVSRRTHANGMRFDWGQKGQAALAHEKIRQGGKFVSFVAR
jgi:hypothetical protein